MAWNIRIPIKSEDADLSRVVINQIVFKVTDRANGIGDVTAVITAPKAFVNYYDTDSAQVFKIKYGLVDTSNNPGAKVETLPTVSGFVDPMDNMYSITEDGIFTYHGDIDRGQVAIQLAVTMIPFEGDEFRKVVPVTIRTADQSTMISN